MTIEQLNQLIETAERDALHARLRAFVHRDGPDRAWQTRQHDAEAIADGLRDLAERQRGEY